ncbi:MAG TPA: DNA translocase FtsK 4TM domain-containing protein [Longimicrobiaceae bacterium]|nr:DNA translocase FtsK 4TM domain-containing protein [Longimicrobiaceae bacterium]
MRKGFQFAPDERLSRDLWGLGLFALALLLTLSLLPPTIFGDAGIRLFPTGNIVGVAGAFLAQMTWDLLGITAVLVPLFPALWGAAALQKIQRVTAIRWTILLAGLAAFVPAMIHVSSIPLDRGPAEVGWLGTVVGGPLARSFGWLGAALLIVFAFAALSIATVGWNPMRSIAGGGIAAWLRTRRLVARLPDWIQNRIASRHADGSAPPAIPPVAHPEDDVTASVDAQSAPPRRRVGRKPREPAEVVADDTGDPQSTDRPTSQLLTSAPPRDELRNRRELDALGQVLIDKLATFKIAGEIVGMTTGPVVTQFEVSPAPGVKVARIANLDADLALAMRAPSLRILAPIPGKAAVGVEVPNPEPEMVYFREVLESPAFRGSRAQLPLALGKDISGRPYVADLAKMPHLLIAGATGSGKSVCVNTIITSLIYKHSPRTLRLLMVDPKMVELSMYNELPHLRHPVVTDNQDAAGVLKWAVIEMERRYGLLSANGVRNLQDFNKRVEAGQPLRSPEAQGEEGDPDRWLYQAGPLPYVVLIIDELADLMMTVQGDVEKPLALLAQKARAIGIHLILATQRPSVNVITGLIKANFPSRIAFRVSSKVDSRTILDQNGADSLLGNGDMLFLPPGGSDPTRIQGAFLSTEETERLMAWYREQAEHRHEGDETVGEAGQETDILDIVRATEGESERGEADEALEDRDKLFREAAELCVNHQGGSTSLLQRRLRIGYGRAARIIDQLHHAGVLGPPDGSKPREILMDSVQLDQMYPDD